MSRPPRPPLPELTDDVEVPDDVRRRAGRSYATGCLLVGIFIIFPAVLYFGFFAVVVLEEIFIGSGWFQQNLPEPVGRFLQMIYTPLFWLIDQFDG
ncbi:MAG TPA: hypothetical protein VGN57_18505 [Pirellulaceae bacterium]|jgi:hypothetical protein|nr:hypothetical protein [Pirellulaceae bacterium]